MTSAVFSPDGARIVTASSDNTAKVWDARTGAKLVDLAGHTDTVNSAVFSPDGARILTASLDNTSKVWDARTGAKLADLAGHVSFVNSAVFSPDGARIARTGAKLFDLAGHTSSATSAVFSPDGARIVTASEDKTAKVWDVHLETRSPAEIAEILAKRAPVKLENGVVVKK